MSDKFILITGASGYIGSHIVLTLIEAGFNVLAMQNSQSPNSIALKKVGEISLKNFQICRCDLLNYAEVEGIFNSYEISTVIHLAASKGVSQSMQSPIYCYRNNLVGTINLLQAMKSHNVHNLIFSSSCAVYGNQCELPVKENAPPISLSNVYARSKYFVEEMLRDISKADKEFKIIIFRYFNVVGAHKSELIGEDPSRQQTSLLTLMGNVALGKSESIIIYGSDLKTCDGSSVRDYVHVMDISDAIIKGLEKFNEDFSLKIYNLGSNQGTSLLQLINTFERVNNVKISYVVKERRGSEIESIVADTSLVQNELKWKAMRSIEEMCKDCFNFLNNFYNNNIE